MSNKRKGAGVLNCSVGDGEVIALKMGNEVSRRSAFRISDRSNGDTHLLAIVCNLPVVRVTADDRRGLIGGHQFSPGFNSRAGKVFTDLVGIMVLEDSDNLFAAAASNFGWSHRSTNGVGPLRTRDAVFPAYSAG